MQALPPVGGHIVPSALFGVEQAPPMHVAVWHVLLVAHVRGVPLQTPFTQASPRVHASPSSQVPAPVVSGGYTQLPVDGSQVPAKWHWSFAVHTTAVPTHVPPTQVSPAVHASPSLHGSARMSSTGVGVGQPAGDTQVPATWH